MMNISGLIFGTFLHVLLHTLHVVFEFHHQHFAGADSFCRRVLPSQERVTGQHLFIKDTQ